VACSCMRASSKDGRKLRTRLHPSRRVAQGRDAPQDEVGICGSRALEIRADSGTCGADALYLALPFRGFSRRLRPRDTLIKPRMAAAPGAARLPMSVGKGMAEAAAAIVAENASKLFLDGAVVAFHQLALKVERNEIMCVVGPSGCGKTTLLRCIAGLTDL